MIRLIAITGLMLAAVTAAPAQTRVAPPEDGLVDQGGCRPGMTRTNVGCVARSSFPQLRRCVRWNGYGCSAWQPWQP